ncbi:MAG: hypothetical protein ACK5BF_14310, partial [Hyphomonadaceae bacterium]
MALMILTRALLLSLITAFACSRPRNQTNRFREGFRMPLGVRKYPKNESLVLWAVAMGISAEGLDWWGLLKPGLAGLG